MTNEEILQVVSALRSEKESLLSRLRELEEKLSRYRVKCPTCRCRLYLGEYCRCCECTSPPDMDEDACGFGDAG